MNDFENTKCDFCKEPAAKDAKIAGASSWAYVCDDCFFKYCSCNEGTFTTLKNIGKHGRKPYSD
jgi:hypothetical protein